MEPIKHKEHNPEFDAYLPLFKKSSAAPVFPELTDDWFERSAKITFEDTTMAKSSGKNKIYLSIAALLLVAISAAVFVFINLPAKVAAPDVAYDGKLRAVVVFLKGEATKVVNDTKSPLRTGDVVTAGVQIVTGANTAVDLAFEGGGAIIRLRDNTDIVLATPVNGQKGIYIKQSSGETLNVVKKLTADEVYGSISPTAVAAVRGTIYTFTVESSATVVAVTEGKIEATGLKGRTETHIIEADRQIRLSDELDEPTGFGSTSEVADTAEMEEHVRQFQSADAPKTKPVTKKLPTVNSEADLKRIYKQEIELISLQDGRVLRGVVVEQSGGKLLVQTVKNSFEIDEANVKSIRYVTEEETR